MARPLKSRRAYVHVTLLCKHLRSHQWRHVFCLAGVGCPGSVTVMVVAVRVGLVKGDAEEILPYAGALSWFMYVLCVLSKYPDEAVRNSKQFATTDHLLAVWTAFIEGVGIYDELRVRLTRAPTHGRHTLNRKRK